MKTKAAVNDFLNSRLAQNLSPATIIWYRAKLQRFAQACPKLPKDRMPVEAFLVSLETPDPEKKYSRATIQNHFIALQALFKFVSEEKGTRNPMARMRPPRGNNGEEPMATLEAEEMLRLVLSSSSQRDRAILTLFVDTGVRVGELVGLREKDIRSETIIISGKSGKREVPISEETRRLLLSLTAANSRDDHVFQGRKGRLTEKGVYGIVQRYMESAGIMGPKLGPHRIRHGFAKNFLVNGGDLRSLQKIMGHKRITTTERYTEFVPKELIAKHRMYSPLSRLTSQISFLDWDKEQAVREAEQILEKKGADHG